MPAAKAGQYFFWFDFGKAPVKIDLSRLHLYVAHVQISEQQARALAKIEPAAVARRIDSCRKGDLTVLVVDKAGRVVPHAPDSILLWAKKNQLIPFAQGLVSADDYPSWQPQTSSLISPAIRGHILAVLKKYGDKIGTWSIYGGATTSIAGDAKTPFQAWVSSVNGAPGAVQKALEWSRASSAGAHDLFEISEGNEALLDKGRVSGVHKPMPPPRGKGARFGSDDHEQPLVVGWHNIMRHHGGHRGGSIGNWKNNPASFSEQEWEESQQPKEKFKRLIETLQINGVQVDLVGLRFNMRQQPIEATEIWKNCALLTQLQIPLQIDELAVLSGEPQFGYLAPASWPSTTKGEEEQAKRIVEAYGVLFSNRSVRGIYYLNICDRESLNHAPYGLLRADGTQKPAYKALLNLLHHTWWTQTAGKTDDKGTFSTKAFWGDYSIVVEVKGKSVKMRSNFPPTQYPQAQTVKVTLPE
ncbi:unnamed protein product [Sphagnum compactum]